VVVGEAANADNIRRPFLYSEEGGMQEIGGTFEGSGGASGINDSGTIVGNFRTDAGFRGFIHENGMTSLLPLAAGAIGMGTADINNLGWIIGTTDWGQDAPTPAKRGYLYIDGEMFDLSTLIDPRWTVRNVRDINDAGQIVAEVCSARSCDYALLSPVPEPAAWLLLGTGLPALAAMAWMRRARRA